MRIAKSVAAAALALLAAGSLATAQEKTVRIGTEGAYAPFNFFDSNNELQGFDIDIAKAVCEKMKVTCTFVAQDWDGIIPALQAGKYDAIFASMSITDERKQVIDFSRPYYNTPSAFFAAKGSGITDVSPEALAGKTLGAQSSTIQAGYLEETYKGFDLKLYPTQEEVNLDLTSGRIDALFVDKLVGMDWVKTEAGACCEVVGNDIPIGGGVGAGVRKEDTELRDAISKAIEEIKADGTYDKINAKYFNFSIWPAN
ncbi:ABC transporter substrate-binding protein [Prosthecomicrobium pneumaticum]|uniref:Polar amino acid transport system substrate-binding protein n=1 Tax=Prosthecomicrobium pneumaticum TaxID=81895 RepID=A0A7W9FPQ7_9HYPH|nr:ABC transporter substrate-binding protein [Prosthecomicrobium pneumaticum]MBB5754609.1 polar amino acid transport system substrate-binding protein [Prosthecomicrobium pneumaticum]